MSADDFAPVVRDADPIEQAEEEERRRGPVGLGRAGRNVAMLAAALSGPILDALAVSEPLQRRSSEPLDIFELGAGARAEAQAANARAGTETIRRP